MDRLAVEGVGLARADDQQPPRRQLAGGRQGRVVALAGQLAEGGQGRQLAAGAPVDLAQRAFERRLVHDRDGQDVGGESQGWSVAIRSCMPERTSRSG